MTFSSRMDGAGRSFSDRGAGSVVSVQDAMPAGSVPRTPREAHADKARLTRCESGAFGDNQAEDGQHSAADEEAPPSAVNRLGVRLTPSGRVRRRRQASGRRRRP